MATKKGKYAAAGVDIDAANLAKELIKKHVRTTFGPQVLGDVGFFGGLFRLAGYQEPVLVASADGVGTKLKVAALAQKHDTVGLDIVHHSVNDILTCGADPLFFLDYIAMGKLVPEQVESIVSGLAKACRGVGCALIGGETAEMPGVYAPGDYDLVGFIVGGVEKSQVLNGASIQVGDVVLGLPSSGLHTNGYSLVRKVFGLDTAKGSANLERFYPELGRTLGEALLEPHRCYYGLLKPLLPRIKGLAHITGGGLLENLPRTLPTGLAAHLKKGSWRILPLFSLIQQQGQVSEEEMNRIFNLGIGMMVIVSPEQKGELLAALPEAQVVGQVISQKDQTRVIIE